MNQLSPNAVQKNLLKFLIKNTHEKDPSGAFILNYGKTIFYMMLVFFIIIFLGMVISPPKEIEELLIALLLLGAAIYLNQ